MAHGCCHILAGGYVSGVSPPQRQGDQHGRAFPLLRQSRRAQFQQAIGAAGKVVTDSTLPPATLQQADYGRVEIVVVDLEPVEAMTFEAHNDVGPHRARDGHDLGSRECDADKTLKLPRRTTPPATDEPRPGGGIAQTSWPGLVSSRTRRGYGITLLTAYSAWASVNPSP